jgi:3-dehydroquinate synthetase
MIGAGAISRELGLLDDASFALLEEAISLTGRIPEAFDLDDEKIFSRLSSDKKAVNGSIQWVLIDRIGSARITDSHPIPPAVIRRAIRLALDHKLQRSTTK